MILVLTNNFDSAKENSDLQTLLLPYQMKLNSV